MRKKGFTPAPTKNNAHKPLVRGFTLIELCLALVLLVLISGSTVLLMHKTVKSWERVSENIAATQLLQDISDKIAEEIKVAEYAMVDKNKLMLFFSDHTLSYDYKNSKVRRMKGSHTSYLSIEGEISNISFIQAPTKLINIIISSPKTVLEAAALCRN